MKILISVILLILNINVQSQIDSTVTNYFNLEDYKVISFKSQLNWELQSRNEIHKRYLRRVNDLIFDSLLTFGNSYNIVGYSYGKYRIKRNIIRPVGTFSTYGVYDTFIFKQRDQIFRKKNNIQVIDYIQPGYDSLMTDYKKIIYKPKEGSIVNFRYFDEMGKLRISGEKQGNKYYGKWFFYNKKGEVEAIGIPHYYSNRLDIDLYNLDNKTFISFLTNNGFCHFRFYFGNELRKKGVK